MNKYQRILLNIIITTLVVHITINGEWYFHLCKCKVSRHGRAVVMASLVTMPDYRLLPNVVTHYGVINSSCKGAVPAVNNSSFEGLSFYHPGFVQDTHKTYYFLKLEY